MESEEESDAEPEESEEESDEETPSPVRPRGRGRGGRAAKMAAMPRKKKTSKPPVKKRGVQPRRGRGRGSRVIEEDSEGGSDDEDDEESDAAPQSEEEVDQEDSDEGSDDAGAANSRGKANEPIESEIEWDEYCYVCQDGGNVMCCETCPQVAHYQCLGLRQAPKGEWYCKDCIAKKAA